MTPNKPKTTAIQKIAIEKLSPMFILPSFIKKGEKPQTKISTQNLKT